MSQTDITKQALAQIGTRSSITSMTDGSPESNYASLLYVPLLDFLLVEGDYDWSLVDSAVTVSGTAFLPWNFSYTYPTGAIRIRQLIPVTYAALDPKPLPWNVVNSGGSKRIWTKTAASRVIYTQSVLDDALWDALFKQSFVRLLGSALAFALENRIEASDKLLKEAISFAGIANLRDS